MRFRSPRLRPWKRLKTNLAAVPGRARGTIGMRITIEPQADAVGYNVLWGFAPDKLYHSCMTFTAEQNIGALVEGETVYVRVDAFNENGIIEGTEVIEL